MNHSSIKCVQCGLVNFATAESCKRCGNALVAPKVDAAQTKKSVWPLIVGGGIFLLLCALVSAGYAIIRTVSEKREVARNAEIARVAKDHNRELGRSALSAIGELQSITSVGTNFMQYTSALQAAKIKFDAALRNYAPNDGEDREVAMQLIEAFDCYVDARDAWSQFNDIAVRFPRISGIVLHDDSVVKPLAEKYRIEAERDSTGTWFDRTTVIQAIWTKANSDFQLLSVKLNA